MKISIISYSLTGNNSALAANVAKKLSVKQINISETKSRFMFTIIVDMIFNRKPPINAFEENPKDNLLLIFGPVWLGQVASPLRCYLQYLKSHPCNYVFISISGGADGANPKLKDDLKRRTGMDPLRVIDLHIADLLPMNPKPIRKNTSAYKLSIEDVEKLSVVIMKDLEKII